MNDSYLRKTISGVMYRRESSLWELDDHRQDLLSRTESNDDRDDDDDN